MLAGVTEFICAALKEALEMDARRTMLFLFILMALLPLAKAQSLADSKESSSGTIATASATQDHSSAVTTASAT